MFYSENALGLCHVLARACPKPQPQIWDLSPELRDQWEIERSEVQLIRKLGHGNFGEVWYGEYFTTGMNRLIYVINCILFEYSEGINTR